MINDGKQKEDIFFLDNSASRIWVWGKFFGFNPLPQLESPHNHMVSPMCHDCIGLGMFMQTGRESDSAVAFQMGLLTKLPNPKPETLNS